MKRWQIVASCLLSGLVAAGQTLPMLNLTQVSNRAAVISWPYTNSTFALEETSNLTATRWQTSLIAPGFDSNAAVFSAWVPTTNPTTFFRLGRSADPRGIYVYSSDVYSIAANYALTVSNALGVPGVDALVLVIGWQGLEPANQVFSWTNLDRWMDNAIARGKKVDLAILAGSSTPGWLFDQLSNGGGGATPLNFTISPHSGATGNCIPETIAAPWDTNFLAAWSLMLSNLANHLTTAGTYTNVTLLRLTGINRTTDELRLPAETAQSTGLACVSNAPAIWQAAGYTPDKLLFGWSNLISSFQTCFPDKLFSVAIIPSNAFPPIDDNTNLVSGSNDEANQPLLALAAQELPGRLVVQFNFLMTSNAANVAVPAAAQNYGTLTAYQSNNYYGSSGGGAACGGTPANPVACTETSYLGELEEGIYPLGLTNSLRSQYLEVFPANVLEFTNAIWQAHFELRQ